MLHRVGHFTAKNVPGGWGISSHDNVENPCPHYSPRLGGWGLQLTTALDSGDFFSFVIEKSSHVYNTRRMIKKDNEIFPPLTCARFTIRPPLPFTRI